MSSAEAGPCYFVIFGATGNLASAKLLPALYELECAEQFSVALRCVAFSRRPWQAAQWRAHLKTSIELHLGRACDEPAFERLAARFDYLEGDLNDAAAYVRLMQKLAKPRLGSCENIIFYLAINPADFVGVIAHLSEAGINRAHGRHRIVVGKPFGHDLDSARALNALLHQHFDEEQIYRIDHFLGKETVQNLLVFRFANTMIEPIWNRSYIDSVQITVAEAGGVGRRAGYYDASGALRDMLQNHLMQLLTLVAMEPPASLAADTLRDEKVKVLRSIRPIAAQDVDSHAFRAQYRAGGASPGYLQEAGVPSTSLTETFAALRLEIDNWRWHGVPFFLRTGKRLARDVSLIAIRFRQPPQRLFLDVGASCPAPNWVLLSLQPQECMHIEVQAKEPGLGLHSRTVRLNASYRSAEGSGMAAYETLLLDVIEGDRSRSIRFDEVEWAWQVVDPVLSNWTARRDSIVTYAAGGSGPTEASRLFLRDDQRWRDGI